MPIPMKEFNELHSTAEALAKFMESTDKGHTAEEVVAHLAGVTLPHLVTNLLEEMVSAGTLRKVSKTSPLGEETFYAPRA